MMGKREGKSHQKWEWAEESDELIRGISGGFLFGIPLLYTMEVWWIGSYSKASMRLVALAITYLVVFFFNRTAGFRRNQDIEMRWRDTAMESVEAIAIGLVSATVVLILLRQIDIHTPLNEALGKAIFEGLPFSLGVALATSLMSGDRFELNLENNNTKGNSTKPTEIENNLADLGATLIGAIFIAFNIAPTDEVPMLAAASSSPWQIAVVVSSLLISYCIVFAAGFRGQKRRYKQRGVFQDPLGETLICYLVSLGASVVMLWFFQKLNFSDPWQIWLNHSIILGLPAAIGGAAGRLAV